MNKPFLFFVFFVLVVVNSYAQPQIAQSFSSQTAMIGQPLYWTIEVIHPLWNSYQVTIVPCTGAEITLASRNLARKGDQVATTFRIKIVPQALAMPDVPAVSVVDQSGHVTAISGKAIAVRTISGTSLEIQQPIAPPFRSAHFIWIWIFASLVVAAIIAFFYWRRYKLAHNPRTLFLRDLNRARQEFRRERSPNATGLNRVLRSMFVWQANVESRTPLELLEFAANDQRLLSIAQGLIVLERYRYAEAIAAPGSEARTKEEDRRIAERALAAAVELVGITR